jgi:4-hydroxybenzoyl-CoA reductase subunit beta
MMRLPRFRFVSPRSLGEAVDVLAAAAPGDAMIVAGGTDLIPNMKRRQQTPRTLVGLRAIPEIRAIRSGDGLAIGAGVTLTRLARTLNESRLDRYSGLMQALSQIATPHLRNMGTIGGNLCLDTRCNYYDQNYEWRKAIDFCMKKDGGTCWVAPSSDRCLAVSSTDGAPALMSLGASVELRDASGSRVVPLSALYRNDGIDYMTRRPSEILTSVFLPRLDGWRSAYWKLRRRGSFDFPVLSVGAAAHIGADGIVEDVRIVLGAVASCPVEAGGVREILKDHRLEDERIAEAASVAAQPARPMDNADFGLVWRKRMVRAFVTYALRELRGDDMRADRYKIARQLI